VTGCTSKVRDNGPGFGSRNGSGSGLGISNTRARLLEMYGPGHPVRLDEHTRSGRGALATIEIPYSDHARDYR